MHCFIAFTFSSKTMVEVLLHSLLQLLKVVLQV
jgi:hypothetical protein